jgi:hypothetical protein
MESATFVFYLHGITNLNLNIGRIVLPRLMANHGICQWGQEFGIKFR